MPINNHKEEYKKISKKLRTARFLAGKSQGKVATVIGKSQSYISKVEAGKIDVGAVELNLLAQFYKKPLEDFFS